jgi:site-specific DNA-methyltransferase (adenine-specific)
VAENVLKHGTGAINVDACRVKSDETIPYISGNATLCGIGDGWGRPWKNDPAAAASREERARDAIDKANNFGRWPANFIHDGSGEVLELFPETAASKSTPRHNGEFKSVAKGREYPRVGYGHDDNGGSAARFFYCAKASRGERDAGCDALDHLSAGQCTNRQDGSAGLNSPRAGAGRTSGARNNHPTVKPITLMRYLVRLITPPAGATLDPFMGSGTTGIAALQEGARFIGIELLKDYFDIAEARLCKVLL